jgi:hypothetical protein
MSGGADHVQVAIYGVAFIRKVLVESVSKGGLGVRELDGESIREVELVIYLADRLPLQTAVGEVGEQPTDITAFGHLTNEVNAYVPVIARTLKGLSEPTRYHVLLDHEDTMAELGEKGG